MASGLPQRQFSFGLRWFWCTLSMICTCLYESGPQPCGPLFIELPSRGYEHATTPASAEGRSTKPTADVENICGTCALMRLHANRSLFQGLTFHGSPPPSHLLPSIASVWCTRTPAVSRSSLGAPCIKRRLRSSCVLVVVGGPWGGPGGGGGSGGFDGLHGEGGGDLGGE
jgi:hypothetical protein